MTLLLSVQIVIVLVALSTIINAVYKTFKNKEKLTINGCVSLYGSLIGGVWSATWFGDYSRSTIIGSVLLFGGMFVVTVISLYYKNITNLLFQ